MADSVKKITKKENYATVKAVLEAAEANGIALEGTTYESLKAFIDGEVANLDKKAAAAKERAAKQKAEGDELRETVANTLSAETYMTIAQITDAVGNPDVTPSMVTSRLGQLVKLGRVEKKKEKIGAATEGGKARESTVYRLVAAE